MVQQPRDAGVRPEVPRAPGQGSPPPPERRTGPRFFGAVVLLVVGVPVALGVGTFAGLMLFGDDPDYETRLKLVTSVAVLVPVAGVLWIAWTLRVENRATAVALAVAGALVGFVAVGIVRAGFGSGTDGSPSPTVVNRSSHEVVVFVDRGELRPWVTLGPGETARADRPPFSLDGCYPSLRLVAKTSDGRLLGTLDRVCNNVVWELKE